MVDVSSVSFFVWLQIQSRNGFLWTLTWPSPVERENDRQNSMVDITERGMDSMVSATSVSFVLCQVYHPVLFIASALS